MAPKKTAPAPDDPNALYRVRDRHEKGVPGYLWGENLSLEEAQRFKEKIAALGKSKTVRYEVMDIPYPPDEIVMVPAKRPAAPVVRPGSPEPGVTRRVPAPRTQGAGQPITAEKLDQLRGARQDDPHLEQMRQTALAAASGAAAAANQRHEQHLAKEKLAAKAAELVEQVKANGHVDIPEEGAEGSEGGEPADDLSDTDLANLLGEVEGAPTDDDIEAARAQRDAEEAERLAAEAAASPDDHA